MSNYAENVVYQLPRTQFQNIYSHKTTFNAGQLIPIMAKEILPKDFIKLNINMLIKTTTPQVQVMDTLIADVHFLFVPYRLVYKNFKKFMGEDLTNSRRPKVNYTMPKTMAPTGGWAEGTIADYLTIPTKVDNIQVNSAFFRGYVLCWNEYYRDQQRQDYADFSDGDENSTGSNGDNIITDALGGGKPLPVNKLKDMFTTSLLEPQAGEPVTLPIGLTAPVYGNNKPIVLYSSNTIPDTFPIYLQTNTRISNDQKIASARLASSKNPIPEYAGLGVGTKEQLEENNFLYTDLSKATAATINQLRQAFALQRMLETINRGGARYVEQLMNRWGITHPSDATLQRPEYIGGFSQPLNMEMVVQTSSTNETSPLGEISGFSNTLSQNNEITGAFEEHGILYGFIMVRNRNTYQQGLHPKFTHTDMEDFYNPEFANTIGEIPILNEEIYAQGNSQDKEAFGYKAYGAEYRNEINVVTGQFRSNATKTYDNWHYADDYASLPINNETWIQASAKNVDRTLTLESTKGYNQFLAEISFDEIATRSIPAHNIPGYITSI